MNYNVKKHFVKVYVWGPGYGESIIINISDTILIGIDSSYSALNSIRNEDSLIDDLLSIDFQKTIWLFTHYHYDHFLGGATLMTKYFKHFEQVILPFEYSTADMEDLIYLHALKKNIANTSKKNIANAKRSKSAYRNLRKITNKGHEKIGSFTGKSTPIDEKSLIDENNKSLLLSIEIDGPAEDLKRGILQKTQHQFIGKKRYSKSRKVCNQTSYILHLKYGDFEALFLADAPVSRFSKRYDLSKIDLLKISHHGSKTGNSELVFERMIQDRSADNLLTAVITPYRPSKLPKPVMLKLFEKYKIKVIHTDRNIKTNCKKLKSEIENCFHPLMSITASHVQAPKEGYQILSFKP